MDSYWQLKIRPRMSHELHPLADALGGVLLEYAVFTYRCPRDGQSILRKWNINQSMIPSSSSRCELRSSFMTRAGIH